MTEPALPQDPRGIRASNQDREAVAQVLNDALAEGRITINELQERLDVVYGAKTVGELEPVTSDLPAHVSLAIPSLRQPVGQPTQPPPAWRIGGTPTSQMAIAIMGGAERKGDWVVPEQFTAVAVMGGVDLNLTRASFAAPEVAITAFALMGGVDITVPDDITVIVTGVGVMGGFDDRSLGRGAPGAPVLRVNGLALMGGVDVHRAKKSRGLLGKPRPEIG